MNLKKYVGICMLFLVTVVTNAGTASALLVGTEEMPESMKKAR